MLRLLYSLLYTLAFLICSPYFLVVGLLKGKYLGTIVERFGRIARESRSPSCWVHAVSVGELLAARPLIRKMQQEFPSMPLFISTTTITGQKLAREILPNNSFYFPFDWTWCIRRVFRRLQPHLILIMETEIWPNFLWEAEKQKIPVMLVNGRISDRSFSRYRFVSRFLPLFRECLMQSQQDAERIRTLGAQEVQVMGNIKFDFKPPPLDDSLRTKLMQWKEGSLLWIAGSTMNGEEPLVLKAFQKIATRLPVKLLIAPRHPERFAEVGGLVANNGLRCSYRSGDSRQESNVMILDSIGELASCYQLADVVFIGGTLLTSGGGHNPIEPGYYGKAIVAGPYYANFRAVFDEFLRREAIMITADLTQIQELLVNTEMRDRMAVAAKQLVQENAGACEIVLERVRHYWKHVVEHDPKLLV